MIIDEKTYRLKENNYILNESIKKQIVIGNTFNRDMRHFIGWEKRYNGDYKKTSAFTIDYNGNIYKHFEPVYQSKFFNNLEQDSKSIVILLENLGHLEFNQSKNNFITFFGDIYNKPNDIIEKKWRGYKFWTKYSEEQFESCVKLVNMLCDEFFIPKNVISHNTKLDNLIDFKGVLYKSNLEKYYTDITPAWEFEKFKNNLEII